MTKFTVFTAVFGLLALFSAGYGVVGDFSPSQTPAVQSRLDKDTGGRLAKETTLAKDVTLAKDTSLGAGRI